MTEEVGFNYVGEEKKEPSNVIDYNINSEQTKDLFAEKNANNQTTTGMADVIPGINAPKIRAETSIVGGGVGGGAEIVEISQWDSIDERQPIVDKILRGEFVCVRCTYTPYSRVIKLFFTPCYYVDDQAVRFGASYVGYYWARINCWISGTTITSITGIYGQRNTNV